MLTLTHAREADLPALEKIENACFSDPWSENSLRAQLEGEGMTLLAKRDGRVIGELLLSLCPPEGEVLRIAVLPEERGLGVAAALLRRGIAEALSRGACVLYLEVREGNSPAILLYRACGFSEIGRRPGYYRHPREDALLMQRNATEDEISGN